MKNKTPAWKRRMTQCACVIGLLNACSAWAANHLVEMFDIDGQQTMIFQPEFLKVQPGDSVTFKPSHRTHYVRAISVPPGATKFVSKEDEEYTVTLTEPGVYFYVCPPHLMMAMIGAIQVGEGEAVHQQGKQAAQAGRNLRNRMHANTQRADALFQTMEEVQ